MVSIYNKFSHFHDHEGNTNYIISKAHTYAAHKPNATAEKGSYIYVKALPRTTDMMYMGTFTLCNKLSFT